jgi:TPR repeat protein
MKKSAWLSSILLLTLLTTAARAQDYLVPSDTDRNHQATTTAGHPGADKGPSPDDILVPDDEHAGAGSAYVPQQGATLRDAVDAYQAGDMDTAFKEFSRLAPSGDATAQFYVGYMMDKGLGITANPYAASSWYRQSAAQDYLPAVTYMGYMYSTGHGVVKDDKEAFKWYTRAAQMGNADAQNALGMILRDGRGYKKDYQLAAQWFLQAATQGNARAQSNLAAMYFLGHGVQADVPTAMHWYEMAARQRDVVALTALGAMYRLGEGAPKNAVKAQVYFEEAAKLGHVPAELALAKMYEAQEADKRHDASDAALWYARAAKKGDVEAQTRLGYFEENGIGVSQDVPGAINWYTKAAGQKYVPAMLGLAHLYEDGKGKALPPNITKAIDIYRAVASSGDPVAELKMGQLYRQGKGVTRDLVNAYEWFYLAAQTFPEGEDKHTALRNQIEISNTLTEQQLTQARQFLTRWQPIPLMNQY